MLGTILSIIAKWAWQTIMLILIGITAYHFNVTHDPVQFQWCVIELLLLIYLEL